MIIAALVAIAIPLVFLFIVRKLDLYASGSFKTALLCLAWGGVAFFLAYFINTFIYENLLNHDLDFLVTRTAPVAEELLKSLILIWLVRLPSFTYFVDGAIYGFAVGTAFAVFENILYLIQQPLLPGQPDSLVSRAFDFSGLGLALTRGFSTSLMHGSCVALVGIALGRLKFGKGPTRIASLALGWIGAMALHLAYNNLINSKLGGITLLLAMGVGLGGVGLVAAFIFWGLREERAWLRETLDLKVGVSTGENAVVQRLSDLDILLEPVEERFGYEKRDMVEEFLRLQANLGLKSKARGMTHDPKLAEKLGEQVAELTREMDVLRKKVGVYCMSYVRSILPPETEPVWERLNRMVVVVEEERPANAMNMWAKLGGQVDSLSAESDK